MKPYDQEKLYEAVRKRFKNWNHLQCSGYVHGVVDGYRHKKPRRVYIRGFKKNTPYAIGYIYGFIDAYGEDMLLFVSDQGLQLSDKSLEYRWWI